MKPLGVLAAGGLGAALVLAFGAWLSPENVFAFASALTFCQ
jgi:hypothetical protein